MLQSNTDVATFTLVGSLPHDQSPPPFCNVHICVRQDPYIGCKRSLDCELTIPNNMTIHNNMTISSNNVSRATRSYEEPSDELLQNCEQQNEKPDSVISPCSDKMWGIFYNNEYAEGEVSLQINLQGNDQVFSIMYYRWCSTCPL